MEEPARTKGIRHLKKLTGRQEDMINKLGSGIQAEINGRILSVSTIMVACHFGTESIMGAAQVEIREKSSVAAVL